MVKVPKYYQVKSQILALIAGPAPRVGRADRARAGRAVRHLPHDGAAGDRRAGGRRPAGTDPGPRHVRRATQADAGPAADLVLAGPAGGGLAAGQRGAADRASGRPTRRWPAHLGVAPGTPIHRVERLRTAGGRADRARDRPPARAAAGPGRASWPSADRSTGPCARCTASRSPPSRTSSRPRWPTRSRRHCSAWTPGCRCCWCTAPAGTPTGRIVEWTRSVFRGDRFRFVARHRLGDDLSVVAVSR